MSKIKNLYRTKWVAKIRHFRTYVPYPQSQFFFRAAWFACDVCLLTLHRTAPPRANVTKMDPHRRPGSAVDVVKLVIRSRTQLFLQYRQEFSTGSGGRHHGARGGYGGYGDKDRLVDSPQGISMDDYTEVAPKWVIVSEQAEKKMDEIQDKCTLFFFPLRCWRRAN